MTYKTKVEPGGIRPGKPLESFSISALPETSPKAWRNDDDRARATRTAHGHPYGSVGVITHRSPYAQSLATQKSATITEQALQDSNIIMKHSETGSIWVRTVERSFTHLSIVRMLLSPRLISQTPSSQPCRWSVSHLSLWFRIIWAWSPLMTLPTPIGVLKSPRSLDESNLRLSEAADS